MTPQAREQWISRRRSLGKWFIIYLVTAGIFSFFFVRSFQTPDPFGFALLLVIPLLCLRQAWKMDRLIAACDRQIRLGPPIIEAKENS